MYSNRYPPTSLVPSEAYELRFIDLFRAGHGYVFPCDAQGRVDIDNLAAKARLNYLYARAMVGRELSSPITRVVRGDDGSRGCLLAS